RSRFPRVNATLEIRPRDVEELASLYSRDLSRGGMFVLTEKEMPIGFSLCVSVIHPAETGSFAIEAVVRRRDVGPPRGVGVEFVGMDAARRQELHDFVYAPLYEIDVEITGENEID